MKKKLERIQNALVSYDHILKAITNFGRTKVLSLEEGNFVYWVREYYNLKSLGISNETNAHYFEKNEDGLHKALKYFKKLHDRDNKLKYNNFDRVAEHVSETYMVDVTTYSVV